MSFLLLATLMSLNGCAAVGAILYKVSPPDKIPAKYKLRQEPTAIFAENYANPAALEIDSEQLAVLVADQFRKHKVAPVVDDNAISNLRDKDPAAFAKMSDAAIGQAVGARQIVYIDLQKCQTDVDAAGQMGKGSIALTVRVIDTYSGQTLWPGGQPGGWPLSSEAPWLPVEKLNDALIRRRLQDEMATHISKLFYDSTEDDDTPDSSSIETQ